MSRFSNVTPQEKIAAVAAKLGLNGLKKQQGSTRIIYDMLPLAGTKVLRFFENTSAKQVPFSNMGGNRQLTTGEALTIQYISFQVVTFVNGVVSEITPLPLTGALSPITAGDWNFVVGNQQVIKPNPVMTSNPAFNKNCNADSNLFICDTDVTIMPLLDFYCELNCASAVTVANTYIRMTIEGVGAILNVKETV